MPDNDHDDDQLQSETFDETHLDDEGDGEFLLDEAAPVYDVTRARQDGGDAGYRPENTDQDEDDARERIEREADALLGSDGQTRHPGDGEDETASAADEIELVYSGLMEDERGAQASAAHWESKRLSDEDLNDLGYAERQDQPTGEPDDQT